METKNNSFLMEEPVGKLMRSYSIPCIISLLVGALYNIVDQIFIANATYLGSYGNAANTVVFPLTVIALAIAVMIGDGCCAFVSLSLGKRKPEDAGKSVGNSVLLTVLLSLILCAVYLIFSSQIIAMFGGTVNEETFRHSKEYFFWISLGIPFYMFGQAMNPVIRADGSPKYAMISRLAGAAINNMVRKYGALDAVFGQEQYAQIPMAVVGIVMKFFQIVISIVVGMAAGCIPIVGYNMGAGLSARVKEASTMLSMVREIVFGVGFALLLPRFFGLDGVLYSMPVSDILTFAVSAVIIVSTYRQLGHVHGELATVHTMTNHFAD